MALGSIMGMIGGGPSFGGGRTRQTTTSGGRNRSGSVNVGATGPFNMGADLMGVLQAPPGNGGLGMNVTTDVPSLSADSNNSTGTASLSIGAGGGSNDLLLFGGLGLVLVLAVMN